MVIELNDNKLHNRGIICSQENLQNNNIFSPYFFPENFIISIYYDQFEFGHFILISTYIYLAIIEFGFRRI